MFFSSKSSPVLNKATNLTIRQLSITRLVLEEKNDRKRERKNEICISIHYKYINYYT